MTTAGRLIQSPRFRAIAHRMKWPLKILYIVSAAFVLTVTVLGWGVLSEQLPGHLSWAGSEVISVGACVLVLILPLYIRIDFNAGCLFASALLCSGRS